MSWKPIIQYWNMYRNKGFFWKKKFTFTCFTMLVFKTCLTFCFSKKFCMTLKYYSTMPWTAKNLICYYAQYLKIYNIPISSKCTKNPSNASCCVFTLFFILTKSLSGNMASFLQNDNIISFVVFNKNSIFVPSISKKKLIIQYLEKHIYNINQ